MKIKVIEIISPKQGMKQDTLKGIIIEGEPKLTAVYELVEYKHHTDQQRKLFHPLVRLYYNSGVFSYPANNWLELREQVKRYLGAGIERYEYSNDNHEIIEVKSLEDVPENILLDYAKGNNKRIKDFLKSCADYTRNEMITVCDSLIREMLLNEVNIGRQAKKFNDILDEIGFKE